MRKGYIRKDYRDTVCNMLNRSSLYYVLRQELLYSGTDKDYSTMDEIARFDKTAGNIRWKGDESKAYNVMCGFDLNRAFIQRSYREEQVEFGEDVDWYW